MTSVRGAGSGRERGRAGVPLRIALVATAAVFLASAAANFGVRLALGPVQLGFPVAIWQAAIGETIVGCALLAAAAGALLSWAWAAEGLATVGIAFGLLSERVQGPARDMHIVLVPLVLLGFALLGRQWLDDRANPKPVEAVDQPGGGYRTPGAAGEQAPPATAAPLAIAALLAIAGGSFATASLVHAGAVIRIGPAALADSFPGAVAPEGVIAVVLFAAAAAVILGLAARWTFALGATLFGLLLTLYGLTVTVRSGRSGDVAYHVAVLVLLAVIAVALQLRPVQLSLAENRGAGVQRGQDPGRSGHSG